MVAVRVARRSDRRDPAVERAHFQEVAAREPALYWADRTAAGSVRRAARAQRILEVAGLGRGAAERVLEIGCGVGDYTRVLTPGAAGAWVAVDVAPGLLGRVRAGTPAAVQPLAADVESLPFCDAAFDVLIGNAVLHHLRLDRALPELLRVLRPGGRFCFAEPNLLNPQVFVERTIPFVGRALDNSPGETAFVRWSLARRLRDVGLVDVEVQPFDFLYPLVPEALVGAAVRLGRLLERTPLVAEVAGSLLIAARRP